MLDFPFIPNEIDLKAITRDYFLNIYGNIIYNKFLKYCSSNIADQELPIIHVGFSKRNKWGINNQSNYTLPIKKTIRVKEVQESDVMKISVKSKEYIVKSKNNKLPLTKEMRQNTQSNARKQWRIKEKVVVDTIISKTPVKQYETISTTYHTVNDESQTCKVNDLIIEEGIPRVSDEILYQMRLIDELEIYSNIVEREKERAKHKDSEDQGDSKREYIIHKQINPINQDDLNHKIIENNESKTNIIKKRELYVKDINMTNPIVSINNVSSAIFKNGTKDKEKYKFYDKVDLSPINDNDIIDYDSD